MADNSVCKTDLAYTNEKNMTASILCFVINIIDKKYK